MRHRLFTIPALLCLLWLTGCVRYYKVDNIRARLVDGVHRLDRAVGKAQADFDQKKARCAGAMPRCADLLGRMGRSLARVRGHREELVRIQRDFDRLARGKKRIRSDRPEWMPLKQLKARLEQVQQKVDTAGKEYARLSNELAKKLHGGGA